jgi:hypothetical protein
LTSCGAWRALIGAPWFSVVDDLERKEQRRQQLRAEREHQVLAAHAETRM